MTDRIAHAGDLMARLARLNPAPGPEAPAPLAAEALALRDRVLREPPPPAPPRRRRRRSRPFLAVAFALLALAGGGLGAGVWSVDDISLPGPAGQEFSASIEEVVAERYIRERPPTYGELPPRPAIAFPAGTTYWEAVGQLWAARHAGARIPEGVRIADPLPDGKVVRAAEDGTVELDPAAPVGYDLRTGLVIAGFSGPPLGSAPSLDPCQVILPGRASPPCGDASSVVLQEDAGGSWRAAPAGRTVPTAIVGTTSLAVLERPGTAEDRLSADVLGPTPEETRRELLGRHAPPGPPPAWDLAAGRLALERDGFRYYVVPAPHDVICLVVRSADGGSGGMTCDRRLTLVTAGAISAGFDADGRFIVAGVVGDGYDTAALPDGAATPIAGNVFAIEIPEGVDAVTLSGPAGRHLVPVVGRGG